MRPANAQTAIVPNGVQPEAERSASVLSNTSFIRTFRVDPGFLSQLISLPGAPLESPQDALRSFLISRGVDLSDSSSTRFFYNDRTGILIVRANFQELHAIETALATLSIIPQQVMLQARLAEFSDDALTGPLKEIIRMPLSQVSQAGANPTGRISLAVLTEAQTRRVIRALEQRPGVDMTFGPTITTVSGRQARLSLEQPSFYPMFDPPFTAPGKAMKSKWSTKGPLLP
jgi:type II secretory pathway component GspD/PulD (secretin)